jgi:hypothetical protein
VTERSSISLTAARKRRATQDMTEIEKGLRYGKEGEEVCDWDYVA